MLFGRCWRKRASPPLQPLSTHVHRLCTREKLLARSLVPRGLLFMPTRRMERVIFNKYLGNLMMMLLPQVPARDKLFLSASNVYSHRRMSYIIIFIYRDVFILSFFFFFWRYFGFNFEFTGAMRMKIRFFLNYDGIWYYYYIKKMENRFYSSLKFVSNIKIKFLRSNKLSRKFFKESFDY